MPRKTKWEVDGVVVTEAHIRYWMQTIGSAIPERAWKNYVKGYNVVGKIARLLKLGTFDQVVADEIERKRLKVRKMRRVNTLVRLRRAWPRASNASHFLPPARMRGVKLNHPAIA